MPTVLFSTTNNEYVTARSRFSTLPSKIIKYYFVRGSEGESLARNVEQNHASATSRIIQDRCLSEFTSIKNICKFTSSETNGAEARTNVRGENL